MKLNTLELGFEFFVFVPKGAAGRLCKLNIAENARFETQSPFCPQAASYNRNIQSQVN